MRGITAEPTGAACYEPACVRYGRRAAPCLRTHRLGGKAEIVESCDQLSDTFSIHGVDPFRVLDQHPDVEKRAGVGGDHRSVDAQGPRRVRLAAGVDCVVVDQLNPQLAAESLGGRVDIGRGWHRDPQTLEHMSIVPVVGPRACHRYCLTWIDNMQMTIQNSYVERPMLFHRLVAASQRSACPGTMLSRLMCLTREVTRLRACNRAQRPSPRLLELLAPSVSTLARETVMERDHAWFRSTCSDSPLTHRPARPGQKSAASRPSVDERTERAVPLRLRGAAPGDGRAELRRPPRVGGRSR